MQIENIKTINELSQLDGRVYVYLPSEALAAQFMQQAETEGFSFGDGVKPTERTAAAIMAINADHTINYVGAAGRIAFGAGAKTIDGHTLIRVTYSEHGLIRYQRQIIEVWQKMMSEDGTLLYEGFTRRGKPFGAGTAYFSNGRKYQEGVFGIKGLLVGKEYYPNGNLRFEGSYHLNRAYGPNYPLVGTAYAMDGTQIYQGLFTFHISGLGYPLESHQLEYGNVVQKGRPEIKWFMWNDCSSETDYPQQV